MNRFTALFLILLRLAIGWHFFAEGYHKLDGYWRGPTETVVGKSKAFSSAGYFREGTGPLAGLIRKEIGDPDDEALDLFQPQDSHTPPPLLHERWKSYVDRFCDFYSLDDKQREKAQEALNTTEEKAVRWMTSKEVSEKNFKATTQEGQLPVPTRLALYREKLAEWREPRHSHLVSIGSDAESVRLHNIKADVVRLRVGLLNDLNEYTKDLSKELGKLPTLEQQRAAANKGKAPQPEPTANKMQHWIDLSTMYGLTILGACLLVGLFSRTACLLSAGFLLMTYLCMPPFPWLPTAPNNEGYYLFVNKNVIEMLALLALATTASGRWFGLDAVIHSLLFGRRRPAVSQPPR